VPWPALDASIRFFDRCRRSASEICDRAEFPVQRNKTFNDCADMTRSLQTTLFPGRPGGCAGALEVVDEFVWKLASPNGFSDRPNVVLNALAPRNATLVG
jgi:hypothetical protein